VAEVKFPKYKTFSGVINDKSPRAQKLYHSADIRKDQLKKTIPVEGRRQAMQIIDAKKPGFTKEVRKGFPKFTKISVNNWDTCADLNMWWSKVIPLDGFY